MNTRETKSIHEATKFQLLKSHNGANSFVTLQYFKLINNPYTLKCIPYKKNKTIRCVPHETIKGLSQNQYLDTSRV